MLINKIQSLFFIYILEVLKYFILNHYNIHVYKNLLQTELPLLAIKKSVYILINYTTSVHNQKITVLSLNTSRRQGVTSAALKSHTYARDIYLARDIQEIN